MIKKTPVGMVFDGDTSIGAVRSNRHGAASPDAGCDARRNSTARPDRAGTREASPAAVRPPRTAAHTAAPLPENFYRTINLRFWFIAFVSGVLAWWAFLHLLLVGARGA